MHTVTKRVLLLISTLLLATCASLEEVPTGSTPGRGFLSTIDELDKLRLQAENGEEPQYSQVAMVLAEAQRPWSHGSLDARFGTVRSGTGVYQKHCVKLNERSGRGLLSKAGHQLYAKALAYNLTGEVSYARQTREILMALSRSSGFNRVDGGENYNGSNQCALELSLFLPIMIDSAILLESFPEWTAADKRVLQRWLAGVPYKTVAAIARTRNNNWGTAAAFAGWAIAHYLIDSGLILHETYPEDIQLSPEAARQAHLATQLNMIEGRWRGDSKCVVYGIRSDGGIPDELRRGSTGCDGSYLLNQDGSYDYQIMSISHLVYHAEAVRRHMDNELFMHRRGDSSPLIRKAIHFVINNASGASHNWKQSDLGVLRLASHAYPDREICNQLDRTHPNHIVESFYVPYTKLLAPADACQRPVSE